MDSLMMKKDDRGSPDRDRGRERERSRRGDRPSRFSSNTRDRSPVRERRKTGHHTVYVSNVAYESKWQDIKDLFRTEVGEVSHVQLFTDENDKPRGCGVVAFATAELAGKAVEKMHRFDLKGRKLVVKEDSDTERDKFGRPLSGRNRSPSARDIPSNNTINRRDDNPRSGTWDGGSSNQHQQLPSLTSINVNNSAPVSSSGGSSNASKFGNTYGLSTSFLESLWINGPLVSKVFVANLDYKVDEKKLREVFKLAGKVVHAEINVDKEGKSRGFGVVEYDHPVEAVQSISMLHNQTLFDRRLTVRMDRVDKPEGPPKLPEGLKGVGMGLGTNGSVLNDVARNIPHMTSPQPPSMSSVQQLQVAAAAAAQAQAQFQGAQLAHLTGSNSLAPNLTSVGGLLGSLNVPELANLSANQPFSGATINTSHTLNPALGAGLAGLNAGLASGLGVGGGGIGPFNPINSQNAVLGGNNNSFNNSGSGMHSPGAGFSQSRDFDSMSAALSGNSQGYNRDRDNFRSGSGGTSQKLEWNYNGSSRPLGNGRGGSISNNVGNNMSSGSIRRSTDTVVVKNLPPNTSWHHLMDTFREVGEILSIDMQGKDAGLIKFSSDWEAERAVRDLDRTRLEGRTIDVLFYYS